MVSLQKRETAVREFTPIHLLDESMPVAQKAVEVKKEPDVPAVKTENAVQINTNDLTALSRSELCALMRRTTDKMSADYAMIERITAEAQRRASTEDHGNENFWGDVDYFQYGLAEKVINGHKRYKKRHRFDCSLSVSDMLNLIKIFSLVGMLIVLLILARNIIFPVLFA